MSRKLYGKSDYKDIRKLKKLLRGMELLYALGSYRADTTAAAIYADLRGALNTQGLLSEQQHKYLLLWMEGSNQKEIAEAHGISQQAVSKSINKAVKKISVFLS